MAKIFAVTTSNDSIKLDTKRQGEATFTVTDATGRPVRGLAKVKALGDAKQQWLTLEGESERDFVGRGTQQFTVTVNIPPDVPPGKYGFRLDIASAKNPDEDFTEGPTVTAEVTKVEPPRPKPYWIIPVALMVLVAAIGIVIWATRSSKVKVPAVEGQTVEAAQEDLKKAGLKVDVANVGSPDPAKAGLVKSASPKPGAEVKPDSTVTLEVYVTEKVAVKRVVGLSLQQAKDILEKEQFLKVVVDPNPVASLEYGEGTVAQQSVEGTTLDPGSEVTLTVAGATVKVPVGVMNQSIQVATTLIGNAGLTVNIVGSKLDGQVVKVEPAEDAPVLKGSKVVIHMPNLPCTSPLCVQLQTRPDWRTVRPQ